MVHVTIFGMFHCLQFVYTILISKVCQTSESSALEKIMQLGSGGLFLGYIALNLLIDRKLLSLSSKTLSICRTSNAMDLSGSHPFTLFVLLSGST
jgi:hypothetical protein